MSSDEISNRRCKWLLDQRGFRYWQEAEIAELLALQDSRPDFLVEMSVPVRFFVGVKSFAKKTILDELDPGIRTFSTDPIPLQKRANRLVQRAAEQLLRYALTGLPTLIILDNYRRKGITLDEHTLAGSFGEPKVQVEIDLTTGHAVSEAWVHVDDGSPLAGGWNRHVSAIATLIPVVRFDTFDGEDDFSVERNMKVRTLHNANVLVPFPRDIFKKPKTST